MADLNFVTVFSMWFGYCGSPKFVSYNLTPADTSKLSDRPPRSVKPWIKMFFPMYRAQRSILWNQTANFQARAVISAGRMEKLLIFPRNLSLHTAVSSTG